MLLHLGHRQRRQFAALLLIILNQSIVLLPVWVVKHGFLQSSIASHEHFSGVFAKKTYRTHVAMWLYTLFVCAFGIVSFLI